MRAAPVIVSYTFESRKLQAAINERIKVNGTTVRTFAQIVNTALFSVALKAQKYTPKAEPEFIKAAAFVEVNFVMSKKKGELVPGRKGNKYLYKESQFPNATNALGEHATIELMFAIVRARANLSRQGRSGQSRYNLLTNDRWKLDKSILTSRKVIVDIMERMVGARSSSSAMLKAGWKDGMDILRPYIAKNDIKGGTRGETFEHKRRGDPLGTAVVAKEGWVCWGMVENHVGSGGTALDARQQKALMEYGSAPFAQAIAEEADGMFDYIQKWMDRDAREFERELR